MIVEVDSVELLEGFLVIGMFLLFVGATITIIGAISAGLIIMGVGLIMSGYGGTVYFQRGSLEVGGAVGAVFILIGILYDTVEEALSQLCI